MNYFLNSTEPFSSSFQSIPRNALPVRRSTAAPVSIARQSSRGSHTGEGMWYCEKPARHNQTLGFNLKGFQQPPPPLHQTGIDTRRSLKKKKIQNNNKKNPQPKRAPTPPKQQQTSFSMQKHRIKKTAWKYSLVTLSRQPPELLAFHLKLDYDCVIWGQYIYSLEESLHTQIWFYNRTG